MNAYSHVDEWIVGLSVACALVSVRQWLQKL